MDEEVDWDMIVCPRFRGALGVYGHGHGLGGLRRFSYFTGHNDTSRDLHIGGIWL